ncbi:hypothetical protein [Pandoraea oxalativorans]|uniref:hypothetical protein n=1 Tax=Pandoraea oxalativorans TaxID=573737 RepID=UPI000B1B18C6|nr:hypothetical protein [Pandoraea oxalativorans]
MKQFIKDFTHMTLGAWLRHMLSHIFRLSEGGSQKKLLNAVAYQVAAGTPEGYE